MGCGRVVVVICPVGLEVLQMGVKRRHPPAPELGFISLSESVLYASCAAFDEIERE